MSDINPEQHHAGLTKLWDALDNKENGVDDVFTLCANKIQSLTAERDRLREALDEVVNKLTYHYQGREEVVLNLRHKDIERYRRLIKGGE